MLRRMHNYNICKGRNNKFNQDHLTSGSPTQSRTYLHLANLMRMLLFWQQHIQWTRDIRPRGTIGEPIRPTTWNLTQTNLWRTPERFQTVDGEDSHILIRRPPWILQSPCTRRWHCRLKIKIKNYFNQLIPLEVDPIRRESPTPPRRAFF